MAYREPTAEEIRAYRERAHVPLPAAAAVLKRRAFHTALSDAKTVADLKELLAVAFPPL